MEDKKKLFKWNKAILIALCVLSCYFLVLYVGTVIINPADVECEIRLVLSCIAIVWSMYYAIYAYKKPHGKDMKILMLVFSASLLGQVLFGDSIRNPDQSFVWPVVIRDVLYIAAAIMIAHMSGRLKKVKENKILSLVIIGVLLLVPIMTLIWQTTNVNPQDVNAVFPGKYLAPISGGDAPVIGNDSAVAHMVNNLFLISWGSLVIWLSIFSAYMYRFSAHRDAKFAEEALRNED